MIRVKGQLARAARRALLLAGIYLILCAPVIAAERVLGLRLGDHPEKTRIVLELSGKLPYSLFTLADPYRIVIDLPEVEWSAALQSADTNGGLVSGYRFGLFQPGNSRFVLDLRRPAQVTGINFMPAAGGAGAGATRLVIDLLLSDRSSFLKTAGFKSRAQTLASQQPAAKQTAASPASASAKAPAPALPPHIAPVERQAQVAGIFPPPNPRRSSILQPPQPMAIPPPAGPAAPAGGTGGTAKRPRIIVIDAGHGGVDPGAITAQGVYEKSIVLDAAKRLQALLSRSNRYKVVMTRDSDVFVRLGDRVQLARDSEADLFVSIHADALATRKVRGASVYTLSEQASDKEAELLANKENNSDMIAGIGIGDETDELVKSILIDLAQRETTNKSVHFAKLLLPELNDAGALLKNSHRFAGFRVLKAPDVPSVLVELGLLSNNTDARILTSNAGRQRLAEAIKEAIEAYFRNFET